VNDLKTKRIEYEDFPQVWKNHECGYVTIIYRDHSEHYEFKSRYGKKEARRNDSEYNPYNEVEMEKGNGGQRVHGMKTVKVIDFTR